MNINLNFFRWSALRGIGQSKAAGFTVLIPFIGWAILLNGTAVEYLAVASDLFQQSTAQNQSGATPSLISRLFTLSNLYFAYFGLTFIGVASFMFKAFCPRIIKDYPTPSKYVEDEEKFITDASVNLLAEKTASAYLKQEKSYKSKLAPIFTSRELQVQMDAIVNQMHLSGNFGAGDSDGHFVTPMDTPIVEKILEEVSTNRRVSRALVESFRADARKSRSDFMIMEYFSDDVTLWQIRSIILILYGVGFALLAVPTARTLYKIINSMS
ncbi:hypothetical protein E4V01_06565 [Methylorubrum sp. Q1]|uniref:hypothetical protein n=1 Tax=Methylorubrum sp. Q1 TaxID=2562453 RepID=UPI001076533E|nr:hypothetical protein [Methylorubrum sp. Q1]TFZ59612.1 hypothetical protein E4V01_06565 [Methylorubrum sp. Q1]